jgi:hypothetical protein
LISEVCEHCISVGGLHALVVVAAVVVAAVALPVLRHNLLHVHKRFLSAEKVEKDKSNKI